MEWAIASEGYGMNGFLILSLFCLGMAVYALFTGTLIMRGRYNRVERPIWFWFGTIFYAAAGVVSMVLFLIILNRS